MKVALFIPCYVDQFYPNAAISTLELLEHLGCTVDYPIHQTCCGQPMANAGWASFSEGCDLNFVSGFRDYDYIVCPSGSCVLHIKEHLHGEDKAAVEKIRSHIFELTEFLTDILEVKHLGATFPHRVGLHVSCHGQRGLHLSSMSEIIGQEFSKPQRLLSMVEGLTMASLDRLDECCGFGGTFSVTEEAVSVRMGIDRVADHLHQDVEYITGGDMSCLMHLEGILRRQNSPVKVIHIAEILNSR